MPNITDKRIDELPAASQIKGTDLFVVEQDGVAKSVSGSLMISSLGESVDDALSSASENPVQNKAIKAALDTKADSSDLDGKVDKVPGKGLSTNDYTTTEKSKLAGIQAGAQVNPDLSGYALSENVHNLPSGGTAGQFLVKNSGTDYDVAWVTVPSANGVSF